MTRDEALRMAIEAIENADYHNDLEAIAVIKDIMAQKLITTVDIEKIVQFKERNP